MTDERMKILDMIAQGTISAEEGQELLKALDGFDEGEWDGSEDLGFAAGTAEAIETEDDRPSEEGTPDEEPVEGYVMPDSAPEMDSSDFQKFRNWWFYPLAAGILFTSLAGWLMYAGNLNEWHWFWMSVCIFPFLLFGIIVVLVSAGSRTSSWLHVRVHTGEDEWPRRIAISFPLPLRFTAFLVRTFNMFIPDIPGMEHIPLDELILAVGKATSSDSPLYVEVDEPDGAKVRVYIG